MSEELKPCPFCGGAMQHRFALWPSEGDRDAIIHAATTECPIEGAFSIDTFDDGVSVAEAWNRRALSTRSTPTGAGVEVKPLAWGRNTRPDAYSPYDHCSADTPFGRYQIEWKGWKDDPYYTVEFHGEALPDDEATANASTLDLAKAAAQADYEQRIRSALVLPPPREDMTELRADAFATAYRIVAEHSGLEPKQASPLTEAITHAIIDASVIDSAAESFHSRMIAAEAEVERLRGVLNDALDLSEGQHSPHETIRLIRKVAREALRTTGDKI